MHRTTALALSALLACPAAVVQADPTDRDPVAGEWGYRPEDGSVVPVTPPSLTWIHNKDAAAYAVQWATRPDFSDAVTVENIRWCVYTHSEALKPGGYVWRYRAVAKDGKAAGWSRARRFTVSPDATPFPKPTLEALLARVPNAHPRLYVRPEGLPKLKTYAAGEGKADLDALRKRADALLKDGPTPEPSVRGSKSDAATREFWWSNRTQTEKACMEAEALAFAFLVTGEARYGEGARRWLLHLASWDPDGPTQIALNCEAAKPMLYRVSRAYDWAHEALAPEDRAKIAAAMRRRGQDAWKHGEMKGGNGHLTQPYNSHGNRIWHKMGELAIAFLGDVPEAETWLDYAVNKFYAAYPVWSDDDGGWHEGLSYLSGYMSKFVTWAGYAETTLGIDSFQKPFFAHAGDYLMYAAPPGSPDMGFGDLSAKPPSTGLFFVPFFARRVGNPCWAWWAEQWKMRMDPGELPLRLLWGALPPIEPKAPGALPSSKVFRGTGVAVLNSTLLSAADDVQLRFKSSPMGRQSHGHDPHNSFTLNAYGDVLLTNCVYRDWHGSPFHTKWCWSTRAQNALLVDGEGQKTHSADPFGRIVKADLQDGADYVVGDAAAAYEGRLKRFLRHVVFVKPDAIVIADDVEAAKPATFQWMLHGLAEFKLEGATDLVLGRDHAGLRAQYVAPPGLELRLRQWTGYEPGVDRKYLDAIKRGDFPAQWHVEASTGEPLARAFVLTVLRPHRKGQALDPVLKTEENDAVVAVRFAAADGTPVTVAFRKPGVASPARLGDLSVDGVAAARRGAKAWALGK